MARDLLRSAGVTPELRASLQATLGAAYTIERELGGGGMSRVFVVEDSALHRRIVVKVLPPDMAAEISVARFQREIALVARLQHPHIVPLHAAGETNGLPYFTMPFVEGESLRARLARDGELPIAEAVRLLREIASALAYAHDQRLVHRDVKPDNVLLTGGVALVTDFGVAKALADSATEGHDGLTSAGIALGTPAYMAPEQATADPMTDHRADIYSFGVVAYEMLVGQPPFAERSAQRLIASHLSETPVPPATRRAAVPSDLSALVMRCLEKRPADRPQSVREIIQALDAVGTPSRTNAASRAPRWRDARVAIAVVILMVAASGAWFAWRRRSPSPSPVSKRVLVVPFENLTGDSRFDYIGPVAADRLTQDIAQVGSIDVVPSNLVLLMLRDTTGGRSERLQRLAAATHAGILVSGSVLLRRDSLIVQAQVTEVRGGKIVFALQPAMGSAGDPIAAVDALGDRLLGALASREMTMVPQDMRAPKYAAYQELAAGFERFAMRGDNMGSRPFFERAIAIDSTYARAYSLLARQYVNAGEYDRADSVLRKVRTLRGLTAAERLTLDYQQSELDGDLARGLRIQQQLAASDSSAVALTLIGEAAIGLMQPQLAVSALQRSDSVYTLMGGSALRRHTFLTAEAYHELGQHDRELAELERRRSIFANPVSIPGRELRAYGGARRGTEALALADTLLRAPGDSSGSGARAVVVGAQEFQAHGDPATASRLLAKARGWYTAHQGAAASPDRTLWQAVAELADGMPDSAARHLVPLTRDTTVFEAIGFLGLSEAARGNRERARVIADSLGSLRRRWLFGVNTFWRAAILGALGERDEAVQLLQQANHGGQRMEDWHYTTALASLHGYPAFDALVHR